MRWRCCFWRKFNFSVVVIISPLVNFNVNCVRLAWAKRNDKRACIAHVVDHALHIHDTFAFLGRWLGAPAQQNSKVVESRWKNMSLPEVVDSDIHVALAQFLSVLVDQKSHMHVLRRFPAECIVQVYVPGCRDQPLLKKPVSTPRLCPFECDRRQPTAPRTTWVIFIRWSSTTLAKWYVGKPSDFIMMK